MNHEEYRKELKQLNDEFGRKKVELGKKYALSNNPYKIGDVIKDHIGFIKIESIDVNTAFSNELPECTYYGTELKSDGVTPKKSGNKRQLWQLNIEAQ